MIKINFKKIIENFSNIWDKDKLKFIITPNRDWKIIVTSFFILFILLSVGNIYFFRLIDKEKIFFKKSETTPEKIKALDVVKLKKVVKYFENKEKMFNTLVVEKPNIIDPSL